MGRFRKKSGPKGHPYPYPPAESPTPSDDSASEPHRLSHGLQDLNLSQHALSTPTNPFQNYDYQINGSSRDSIGTGSAAGWSRSTTRPHSYAQETDVITPLQPTATPSTGFRHASFLQNELPSAAMSGATLADPEKGGDAALSRDMIPFGSSAGSSSGDEKNAKAKGGAVDLNAGGAVPKVKEPFFRRMYLKFRRTYCPLEEPPLVLPSGPTDTEKYCYVHTNRIPLYILGVFSFLSLSAGMWLFTLSSIVFCWFGVLVGLLQLYLLISYFVGVIGKDFDLAGHNQILEQFPITDKTAPTVDVYLPCCKEPLEILENTYQHIINLDYPAGKVQVHVLDDGDMDEVRQLAGKYGFNYIVREDRPRLKKAGNLRWAFARTSADFFVIFDADFCPRPDFLLELMPEHLADPATAIVQTPQFFRVSDEQTWVEQGAGATQELFYRVVQVNRNRWGASICVGSNAMYRREALEPVGGTAEIGFSEDVHTGFGAVDRGWKVKYLPLCLATGVCPDNPRAFFSQQMRWARGSTTLLTNPHFWTSKLSVMQKICYLCGLMYYSAISLSIFISPIPGILLLWIRPEFFKFYNLAFAIPSIFYGVIMFRFWAKARYGLNVHHVMVIMSYAYLTAIKDRLFGRGLHWVPSGDAKAHKNNKYRNMRILCWIWTIAVLGGMISAIVYRLQHDLPWYHCLPLIILNVWNTYLVHYFLFYCG